MPEGFDHRLFVSPVSTLLITPSTRPLAGRRPGCRCCQDMRSRRAAAHRMDLASRGSSSSSGPATELWWRHRADRRHDAAWVTGYRPSAMPIGKPVNAISCALAHIVTVGQR